MVRTAPVMPDIQPALRLWAHPRPLTAVPLRRLQQLVNALPPPNLATPTASCIAEPHSAALCSTRGHSLSLYPAARSHESRRTAPPTSLRQQLPEHSIPATSEEHTA